MSEEKLIEMHKRSMMEMLLNPEIIENMKNYALNNGFPVIITDGLEINEKVTIIGRLELKFEVVRK